MLRRDGRTRHYDAFLLSVETSLVECLCWLSSQTNRAACDGTRKQQRLPEVQEEHGEEQCPCGTPEQRELQQAHPQC